VGRRGAACIGVQSIGAASVFAVNSADLIFAVALRLAWTA